MRPWWGLAGGRVHNFMHSTRLANLCQGQARPCGAYVSSARVSTPGKSSLCLLALLVIELRGQLQSHHGLTLERLRSPLDGCFSLVGGAVLPAPSRWYVCHSARSLVKTLVAALTRDTSCGQARELQAMRSVRLLQAQPPVRRRRLGVELLDLAVRPRPCLNCVQEQPIVWNSPQDTRRGRAQGPAAAYGDVPRVGRRPGYARRGEEAEGRHRAAA